MSVLAAGPRSNIIGAACAMAGAASFSVNDALIKYLSGDYALNQIVFLRAVVALSLLVPLALVLGRGLRLLRTRRPGMHALRGVFMVTANTCFFLALAVLPLADAMALFFVAPLLTTALSVVVLGERVGPWRWAAVALGLAGVLVMLRPGTEAFQPAAILALCAAAAYSALGLITRRNGGTEAAATFAVYAQGVFLVVSLGMGLFVGHGRFDPGTDASLSFLLRAWTPIDRADLPIFVAIGTASAAGAWLISQAYRIAEAGVAAPFEYVALPLAVLWGMVLFADLPDTVAVAGMALIAGGGLLLIWRETRAARSPRRPPTGEVPP
ncbi:MAG: DMT family transporter [Alkalilacustris sp.]